MTEPTPAEYVGYESAAEYVGLKRNTLSSYVARGIGPRIARQEPSGQYNLPVFTSTDLDKWVRDRPGQGARTDLAGADPEAVPAAA